MLWRYVNTQGVPDVDDYCVKQALELQAQGYLSLCPLA